MKKVVILELKGLNLHTYALFQYSSCIMASFFSGKLWNTKVRPPFSKAALAVWLWSPRCSVSLRLCITLGSPNICSVSSKKFQLSSGHFEFLSCFKLLMFAIWLFFLLHWQHCRRFFFNLNHEILELYD